MAIFPFERGLGETTELSVIRDLIIRSLGSRAGAEIRCHKITIWLFTPLLVLYRYGEGWNGAFTVECLRIGGPAELSRRGDYSALRNFVNT